MFSLTNCPICNGTTWSESLVCQDHTASKENFTLQRCRTCEFIVTSPRPDNHQLGRYYISTDYISHTDKAATFIDRIYILARSFTLRWKINIVRKYLSSTDKLVLDYGCGTGDFLNTCRENNMTIAGVEPSPAARRIAEEKTGATIATTIEGLDGQQFDVITLWHVLEHVPQLNDLVSRLASSITENGTIFIAVPNHKSYDAAKYKQHWAAYDVPRHLWHFSRENITRLLANHSLTVQTILPMKLDSYYVSMLSEKHKCNGRTTFLNLLKAVFTGFISNTKARRTGDYSSLIYICKK